LSLVYNILVLRYHRCLTGDTTIDWGIFDDEPRRFFFYYRCTTVLLRYHPALTLWRFGVAILSRVPFTLFSASDSFQCCSCTNTRCLLPGSGISAHCLPNHHYHVELVYFDIVIIVINIRYNRLILETLTSTHSPGIESGGGLHDPLYSSFGDARTVVVLVYYATGAG
jgi:hypothetical protein